jgi:protein phosphatase
VTLSLRYAARSDVGLVRSGNEDSGYAGPRLLVVADGMGGHAAGEVASSVVVASIASLDDDDRGGDLLDALSHAVDAADASLHSTIDNDARLEGMGTTLTALLWSGSRAGVAHVGDSRAYLMRGGDLLRLTHDHTYVQSLVDQGEISAEEAETHPRRSLLMRAMDGRQSTQADLSVREVRPGDRFLLCTDGLTGVVSEATLVDELPRGSVEAVADRLVDLALRSGAPDNVTVVVADVIENDDRPTTAAQVVGAAGDPRLAAHATLGTDSPAAKARRALTDPEVDAEERQAAQQRVADAEAAEAAGRRRRWLRRAVIALLVIAGLVAGAVAALAWTRDQVFVAARDGTIAVFRGVDQEILGVALYSQAEATGLDVNDLPEFDRERVVSGIAVADLDAARAVVERLQAAAASCDLADPPAGCPDAGAVAP